MALTVHAGHLTVNDGGGCRVRVIEFGKQLKARPALPLDYTKILTIDPGKRGGKPCIRGLRITVYDVLEYLASGMSEDEVLADFPDLERDDIRACLAFASQKRRVIRAIRAIRKSLNDFASYSSLQDELGRSETSTRYALIDPILKSLGWNLHDTHKVKFEYLIGGGKADYALFDGKSTYVPRTIVEAKTLSKMGQWPSKLVDAEHQLAKYWNFDFGRRRFGAITDGEHWNIYKVFRSKRRNETSPTTKFDLLESLDVLSGDVEITAEGLMLLANV